LLPNARPKSGIDGKPYHLEVLAEDGERQAVTVVSQPDGSVSMKMLPLT
jgi:hypothetical protein